MKKQSKLSKHVSGYAWLNLGLIAVFLFSSVIVNGQSRVRKEIQENTKVEIYRSLEDVLNDNVDTSVEVDYIIQPREHGVVYKRLLVNRKEGQDIGRVYGFKIGDEVFINPRNPKLRKRINFFKTERIGDYLNFSRVGVVWIQASSGGSNWRPPYRYTYPREELIHIPSGKRMLLTRIRLKKILKDNPTLLKEFKQEERKSMMLIPYLKKHENSTAGN
jgi:hypothetical protein